MKLRVLFILLACLMCVSSVEAKDSSKKSTKKKSKSVAKKPTIKVLLVENAEGAVLEVKGSYRIYDPRTNKKIGKGVIGKNFFVLGTMDGIKWGEGFPGVFQIAIVPSSSSTLTLVNGIQYQGKVYVYQIGNYISIVNELDVENYVKSVLGQAVNDHKHPEVLNALAIVTRTSAYYHATKNPSAFWHVKASEINYQGFSSTHREYCVDKAIDTTRYLVMENQSYGLGKTPFDATYTEHSAGKTIAYHLLYRKDGQASVKGVDAPLAQKNREQTLWETSISPYDFAIKIGFANVTKIESLFDNNSQKVYGLKVYNDDFSKEVDIPTLQSLLGEDLLLSSDFKASLSKDSLDFVGYGKGLGVGLCVYSAEEMAQKGKDAKAILETFFPDSKLDLCYR